MLCTLKYDSSVINSQETHDARRGHQYDGKLLHSSVLDGLKF